jgi:two-component system response regulator DctR
MKREPNVFVVDDDAAMRMSTTTLLRAASLPHIAYGSAKAFLADYHPDTPGCLLLDLNLPGMSGMDLIEQLRAQNCLLPVLIISGTGTIPIAVRGMKLGVVDFLEKPVSPGVLIPKVQAAMELDAQRRIDATGLAQLRQQLANLTPRERELLKLLVGGASNKIIAAELGISIKTVENHRAHIMQKTGAVNTADLVRISLLAEST